MKNHIVPLALKMVAGPITTDQLRRFEFDNVVLLTVGAKTLALKRLRRISFLVKTRLVLCFDIVPVRTGTSGLT